ncbi:MAG: carboxypeptidase-like regulatory domain-containing protein [Saprospiraceae bacterium]
MKYFLLILSLCLMSNWGKAQSPLEIRVDFEVDQLSMADALVQLGEKAGIPISFSNNILPKDKIISLQISNQKVKNILTQMLSGSDVQFKAIGAQVVLFYKKRAKRYFSLNGYIEDEETGERLIAATIWDKLSGRWATANEYGYFTLNLPEGNAELMVSYTGFTALEKKINLSKNSTQNFGLKSHLTLKEIIVTPLTLQGINAAEPLSSHHLQVTQMNKLPTLGGEVELFRLVELMPGVQSGSDGIGGLHVRGGGADQNLILMDGVPIYNPSHSLGIFSVFNSEAIQSVTFSKGAFPARYGGRLSSVMDVRTREGNQKEWSGSIKAGLVTSSARIEGPIIKDKASILITARRTLLDKFIQNRTAKSKAEDQYFLDLYRVPLQGFSNYNFYDLNGKLNYSLNTKNKFYFSYYNGGDKFLDEDFIQDAPFRDFKYSDREVQKYNWGNQIGVFRWNHIFGNNLFLNTTLTHSIFQFDVQQTIEIDVIPNATIPPLNLFVGEAYFSRLKDWGAKLDFDYTARGNHHIRFGINSTLHSFQPGAFGADAQVGGTPFFGVNIDSVLNVSRIDAYEHNAYIEDEFLIGKKVTINMGLLANAFAAPEKTFFNLQPRFSLNYMITKRLRMQAGISRMVQSLHLVTGSDATFPNDLWLPSSELVPPQTSWQSVLGIQIQPTKSIEISIEGYYKTMDNLSVYLDNSSLRSELSNPFNFTFQPIDNENWESQVTRGKGWNYGLEFQVKKNIGKTTGWLSYTWAFADRKFDEINGGNTFNYRYDRRHNFHIALNHRFARWIDASINWTYGTGLSTLLPVSTVTIGGLTLINYEYSRMPANHRLDAGINLYFKTWKLDQKIYLGAYNVYNRANPQYYKITSTPVEDSDPANPEYNFSFYQGSFLPFLPSVSYSISF